MTYARSEAAGGFSWPNVFPRATGSWWKKAALSGVRSTMRNLAGGMNGSHTMIVKLGEDPGFSNFASKERAVKAARMREDFLVETALGYLQGKRGDYVVEIAPKVRFPCAAKEFLAAYAPMAPDGCDRRCGIDDRRKNDGISR